MPRDMERNRLRARLRMRRLRAEAAASGKCRCCSSRPATRGRWCDGCWGKWCDPLPVMRALCGGEPRCQCPGCGQALLAFLSIDHVHNDGFMEKSRSGGKRGPAERLAAVRREPHRFQVLCYNCNMAKGHGKDGRCPREGKPH